MRINTRVFSENHVDMLDGIKVGNVPSQLRPIAENIMNLFNKPGFTFGDYRTMTEADKVLMVAYWKEYDLLNDALDGYVKFEIWFVTHATPPELIRRARQYLTERRWLIP